MTGSPSAAAGDDVRTRILAAAIELFAAKGVDSVSVRELTAAAQVNLAAVNYYFGSKSAVEEAVFAAVAESVTQARCAALDRVIREAGADARPPEVADIVATFIAPYLDTQAGSTGALLAKLVLKHRLAPSDMTRRLVSEHFDPLARRYVEALRLALPQIPKQEFVWRYMFMASAVVLMATDRGGLNRIAAISGGRIDATSDAGLKAALTRFLVGGFSAPAEVLSAPARSRRR